MAVTLYVRVLHLTDTETVSSVVGLSVPVPAGVCVKGSELLCNEQMGCQNKSTSCDQYLTQSCFPVDIKMLVFCQL